MSIWVYVPLFLSCLFGVAAPRIARRLPPSVATLLLSVGGVIAARTARRN
jgi:hypothetical protein